MKVMAVVPTCRGFKVPEQSIPVEWVVVHDRQRWPVDGDATHIIAPDPTLYGSRCSCIRSAGFGHAYHAGATHILTCDDDVLLTVNWAHDHVLALNGSYHPWSPTVDGTVPMRGFPIAAPHLPIAISHGLWSNVPDLAAIDQKALPTLRLHLPSAWRRIHPPFALSSMNFGFRREVTPVMYQPAMGDGHPFKRHDDIWLGVIAQRVLMLHGYSFANGGAVVWHTRASNVDANLVAEAAGTVEHEHFWRWVWEFDDKQDDLATTYRWMAAHIRDYQPHDAAHAAYFQFLSANMRRWLEALQ